VQAALERDMGTV